MKQRKTWFDYVNNLLLLLFTLLMFYPFLYLFFLSISDASAIAKGITKYYPSGINLRAYRMVLVNDEILRAYWNSIRYAGVGTIIMLTVTSMVAYPLSQPRMLFRKVVSQYYVLTMFFSGGMIPTYIVYRSLGFVNTIWVMVLPSALGAYSIMVFKTYFASLGTELVEAAFVDGANDLYILFKIVIPLSKPLLATFALFQIVGIWNDFFTPLLYLNDNTLHPLTIVLRKFLIELDIKTLESLMEYDVFGTKFPVPQQAFRSASIVVAIVPIVLIYPFIQRYFIKGIMIGSLKG